jgi:hypothetical protein
MCKSGIWVATPVKKVPRVDCGKRGQNWKYRKRVQLGLTCFVVLVNSILSI